MTRDSLTDRDSLTSSLEQAAAQLLLAAETGHGRAEEMRELAAKLQVMTTQIDPIEQGA